MKRSDFFAFVITLLLFGFFVPWLKGLDFLDPVMVWISCCISLIYVAPMVATDPEKQYGRGRLKSAIFFAFSLAVLILVNAVATVNFTHWSGHVLHPSISLMIAALTLNLIGSVFIALFTAFTARRTTPLRARKLVRMSFFVLLILFVFCSRFAPPAIRTAFDETMTTEGLTRSAWLLSAVLIALSAYLCRKVLWRSNLDDGR